MKGGTLQINWHDTKPVLTLDFHPFSGLLATAGADFDIKTDKSAREINSWVNEKTRGLIPSIIERGSLKGDEVIALVNALYFKGLWYNKPFDAYNTRVKDFYLLNGQTVSVPFMTSLEEFEYGSFEGCKILQIPYESEGQSNGFSMYIFLPDRKDGLQELLQVFHSDPALFNTRFYLEPRFIEKLLIPKFKISYTFDAGKVVKQMGLTLPFEITNMEFSRIVEPTEDNVYVSKILQKSFIEIDETGTKAAAVSDLDMDCGAALPPQPARFVADHPFMFMIREDTSQAVLFVGVTFKILGENCENMKQIQRVSKASIELLSDAESDYHNHSYLLGWYH